MILLASRIVDGDEPVFPLIDMDVRRNAFGRQLESFETDLDVSILGDLPVHGVFIEPQSWNALGRRWTYSPRFPTAGSWPCGSETP